MTQDKRTYPRDLLTDEEKQELARMEQALVDESPLENETTRRLLANAAVTHEAELRVLRRAIELGNATSDELRTVAPVTNALLKTLERLGVSSLPDPDAEALKGVWGDDD